MPQPANLLSVLRPDPLSGFEVPPGPSSSTTTTPVANEDQLAAVGLGPAGEGTAPGAVAGRAVGDYLAGLGGNTVSALGPQMLAAAQAGEPAPVDVGQPTKAVLPTNQPLLDQQAGVAIADRTGTGEADVDQSIARFRSLFQREDEDQPLTAGERAFLVVTAVTNPELARTLFEARQRRIAAAKARNATNERTAVELGVEAVENNLRHIRENDELKLRQSQALEAARLSKARERLVESQTRLADARAAHVGDEGGGLTEAQRFTNARALLASGGASTLDEALAQVDAARSGGSVISPLPTATSQTAGAGSGQDRRALAEELSRQVQAGTITREQAVARLREAR